MRSVAPGQNVALALLDANLLSNAQNPPQLYGVVHADRERIPGRPI